MTSLLDLSDAFYPTLSDASVRKLCKAREYASDVRRHYQGQPCPDDSVLSTMSEIMMDLVDALLSSKPFRSHPLSTAITKGFSSSAVTETPWLLRFAHSFLLVMSELEQREFVAPESRKTEKTEVSAVTATAVTTVPSSSTANQFTPIIIPMASTSTFSGSERDAKIDEEEQPPINQYPFAEVKEESAELEDPFQEAQLPGSSTMPGPSRMNLADPDLDRNDEHNWNEALDQARRNMLDDELIDRYSIPVTAQDLTAMSLKEFMSLPLTEEQHAHAKYIRRRGLKRLSAQQCKAKRQKMSSQEPRETSHNYVYGDGDDSN